MKRTWLPLLWKPRFTSRLDDSIDMSTANLKKSNGKWLREPQVFGLRSSVSGLQSGFLVADQSSPPVVDSRRRLRLMLAAFVFLFSTIFARSIALEARYGKQFRSQAATIHREVSMPALRGRILARDSTVLAEEQKVVGLAVSYRLLEEPPNAIWLRSLARQRLSSRDLNDPQCLLDEIAKLRVERAAFHRRLAHLSGLSIEQWETRRKRIQRRVRRISTQVNAHHRARSKRPKSSPIQDDASSKISLTHRVLRRLHDLLLVSDEPARAKPILVAEERQHHVVVEDLPPERVRDIRIFLDGVSHDENTGQESGVKLEPSWRRHYPEATLAAHLLGHMGAVDQRELKQSLENSLATSVDARGVYRPHDLVGRMGLERQYESSLRGRHGWERRQWNRQRYRRWDCGGNRVATTPIRPHTHGRDLVLTIDVALQRSAERLLDSALARRILTEETQKKSSGGAIVVLDCHDGAIRAAASAPRFDPNVFSHGNSEVITRLLTDAGKPLLNRVTKMTLPPGSLMKMISATALLESGAVSAHEPFICRGYLHSPQHKRCSIYRKYGFGHGSITLKRALAESCNVYFFHHAARMGAAPLVSWARHFGLGQRTGVDLPDEATGCIPTPETIARIEGHAWHVGDTHALAIGQGSLTVTPLQIACVMATVATGGKRIVPYVAEANDREDGGSSRPNVPIGPKPLLAIQSGLELAVQSPNGTAHRHLASCPVVVAAKTSTVQTARHRADHAWLAGYAPDDAPRVAFVIALEYAGDGASAAGPVAKRLVMRLDQLGYFPLQNESDESDMSDTSDTSDTSDNSESRRESAT